VNNLVAEGWALFIRLFEKLPKLSFLGHFASFVEQACHLFPITSSSFLGEVTSFFELRFNFSDDITDNTTDSRSLSCSSTQQRGTILKTMLKLSN